MGWEHATGTQALSPQRHHGRPLPVRSAGEPQMRYNWPRLKNSLGKAKQHLPVLLWAPQGLAASATCQGLGLCELGSTSRRPPDSRALMKRLPFPGKIPGRFSQESPEHLQPWQTWLHKGDDIWVLAGEFWTLMCTGRRSYSGFSSSLGM